MRQPARCSNVLLGAVLLLHQLRLLGLRPMGWLTIMVYVRKLGTRLALHAVQSEPPNCLTKY
jgi:hypothetical protein